MIPKVSPRIRGQRRESGDSAHSRFSVSTPSFKQITNFTVGERKERPPSGSGQSDFSFFVEGNNPYASEKTLYESIEFHGPRPDERKHMAHEYLRSFTVCVPKPGKPTGRRSNFSK